MYLLDTNVVSELRKIRQGKADPGVMSWAEGVAASDLLYFRNDSSRAGNRGYAG